ncbi:MAG: hypothetical protein KAS67_02170 [Thermoplasmata archaeon]|nr:hypothetical protein [Thermoplasmata archaeon]
MNEIKNDNRTDVLYKTHLPSFNWMKKIRKLSEKVLNNLPLFMFGLLMFATLALDIF